LKRVNVLKQWMQSDDNTCGLGKLKIINVNESQYGDRTSIQGSVVTSRYFTVPYS